MFMASPPFLQNILIPTFFCFPGVLGKSIGRRDLNSRGVIYFLYWMRGLDVNSMGQAYMVCKGGGGTEEPQTKLGPAKIIINT